MGGAVRADAGVEAALDRLFRLQEILLEVKKKTDKRARTPDHLVHIEAAYRDAQRKRDEAGGRMQEAEKRRKVLTDELADLGEKLKKYQQQLVSVKTNDEYGALLNGIDVVKRDVRTREDELLGVEESLATTKSEADERSRAFPGEVEQYEGQMTEWRAEQALLSDDITKGQGEADAIRKTIDRRLLATFDRIAKARAGVGMAKVLMVGPQTAACSACNVRLRPQLLSDLRLSKETILCESCKRILYWD